MVKPPGLCEADSISDLTISAITPIMIKVRFDV